MDRLERKCRWKTVKKPYLALSHFQQLETEQRKKKREEEMIIGREAWSLVPWKLSGGKFQGGKESAKTLLLRG